MVKFWLQRKVIARPRLLLSLLLAPLSAVLALPLMKLVFGDGFTFPGGVSFELSQGLLFAGYFVYPAGLLGCLVVCLPLYFLQRWISFHTGVSYPVAGFLGGALLFWFLLGITLEIWGLEFWSFTEYGQISENFAEALASPALVTGFFGAAVGATFFWLLVRTDRKAA